MKTIPLYICFVLILGACGPISPKGDLETKEVPIEGFQTLELNGKFRVFYVQNNTSQVFIETYGNFIKNLAIKQSGQTLSISEKRETQGADFYNVTVFSPSVPRQIEVGDQVELSISGAISGESLNLKLKDEAKFIGAVETALTTLEMSGLARANFSGASKKAEIKMQDTAHLIAPYWAVGTLKLEAKNGPYVEVQAVDTLKGTVENTTRLLYYNKPVTTFKKASSVEVNQKPLIN